MFYPEVKPHISPSALNAWHNQRSLFIRSYFKGERTPETSAMKAGTKIHGLIEAGFYKAQNIFAMNEEELTTKFRDTEILVLGKPDSFELLAEEDLAKFVDYKTGKNDSWSNAKLATDLKMRTTAFLVWVETGKPAKVEGFLEWIETEWNGEEIVPTGNFEVYRHVYTAEDMEQFEEVIAKTIEEVNTAYEQFVQSEGDTQTFIDEDDVQEYVKLEEEKAKIEAKQSEIKERISEQLTIANQKSAETPFGTFYFTERKKYEYPDDLEAKTESGNIVTLDFAEEVATAISVAKKNYEATHDPASVSRSFSFRAKKPSKKK